MAAADLPKSARDGRLFGLPEGTLVHESGLVYDASGKMIGHMEGWDEKGARDSQKTATSAAILDGAEFEDGVVKVKGLTVGTVDDDGLIRDTRGTPIGRLAGLSFHALFCVTICALQARISLRPKIVEY